MNGQTSQIDVASVAARLRRSKALHDSCVRSNGRAAGCRWASDNADYDELRRLSELARVDELVARREDYGPHERFVYLIRPYALAAGHDGEPRRFWTDSADVHAEDLEDDEFILGFAEGARAVFATVKPAVDALPAPPVGPVGVRKVQPNPDATEADARAQVAANVWWIKERLQSLASDTPDAVEFVRRRAATAGAAPDAWTAEEFGEDAGWLSLYFKTLCALPVRGND
jgi:hypothetical protein